MTKENLTQAALEKGLRELEAASRTPSQTRSAELFQKAQDGTITADERDELVKSVSRGLGAEATSGLTENETLTKSLDVSDFLKEQHTGLVTGLETLADHIEKSETRDQEFRVALATTLHHMGELVKAQDSRIAAQESLLKGIADRLGVIAAQPARGPKSVEAARAAAGGGMQKSFAGAVGGASLSKGQILETMHTMLTKGMEMVEGEDIVKAAIKYESLKEITPTMLKSVQEFRGSNKAA